MKNYMWTIIAIAFAVASALLTQWLQDLMNIDEFLAYLAFAALMTIGILLTVARALFRREADDD